MKTEYRFEVTAKWKDTGKPIPDFMEEYTIEAMNNDSFVVDFRAFKITTEDVTAEFVK